MNWPVPAGSQVFERCCLHGASARGAGLADTGWCRRIGELSGQLGPPRGLVTTPRDPSRLGQLVLDGGVADDRTRIVSAAGLAAISGGRGSIRLTAARGGSTSARTGRCRTAANAPAAWCPPRRTMPSLRRAPGTGC